MASIDLPLTRHQTLGYAILPELSQSVLSQASYAGVIIMTDILQKENGDIKRLRSRPEVTQTISGGASVSLRKADSIVFHRNTAFMALLHTWGERETVR